MSDLIYLKKDQRKISDFVGHELIYDYAAGSLDDKTYKAMTDFLVQNKDSQKELDKIRSGIKYTNKLAEFQISSEMIEKVREPRGYLELLLKHVNYAGWSNTIKWSAEAAVVGIAVALVSSLLPWERLYLPNAPRMSGQMVLSEVKHQHLVRPDEDTVAPVVATVEQPLYRDEEETEKKAPAQGTKTAQTTPPLPPTETVVENKTAAVNPPTSNRKGETPDSERKFVYRAFIRSANVNAISAKIKEKIETLGGRKAGQVPLGWNRPGGSYFHFTIPESQYDEMMKTLEPYGKVKISKDPHPRVMPTGIIRFILWVEDTNTEGATSEE